MAIWTEGREKPSGVEGRWQTSEESEQICMQRGEPYERTYRRGDRSINTEEFTAEGGRREDQGAATLKDLPREGGKPLRRVSRNACREGRPMRGPTGGEIEA